MLFWSHLTQPFSSIWHHRTLASWNTIRIQLLLPGWKRPSFLVKGDICRTQQTEHQRGCVCLQRPQFYPYKGYAHRGIIFLPSIQLQLPKMAPAKFTSKPNWFHLSSTAITLVHAPIVWYADHLNLHQLLHTFHICLLWSILYKVAKFIV